MKKFILSLFLLFLSDMSFAWDRYDHREHFHHDHWYRAHAPWRYDHPYWLRENIYFHDNLYWSWGGTGWVVVERPGPDVVVIHDSNRDVLPQPSGSLLLLKDFVCKMISYTKKYEDINSQFESYRYDQITNHHRRTFEYCDAIAEEKNRCDIVNYLENTSIPDVYPKAQRLREDSLMKLTSLGDCDEG